MKLGKLKDKIPVRKKAPRDETSAAPKPEKLPKKKPPNMYKTFFARKPRFTLLIGDEGTILIYMKGNTVISREFVPDASDGNLAALRETIAKDRQAPITMIIDSVDQSFVQQTLPPVSSLSVKKLIKRRLDRDFKQDDIKGAIILGKDKAGRKDWNFLMISVEKSPQLVLWLDFIMTLDNRFRGIVLLSVEAGIFVKNLERVLGVTPKSGTGSEWKILVSHNKVGGFRQIILRHGRLIFTRLALPVGEPKPAVIAGNIEQEMLSTIEYLKRFGYNARNGLDVYIIASQEVCNLIDAKRFDAQNFQAFAPHALAQQIGIKGATQPGDQFGDVVLASAISCIRNNILKLTTVESRLYDKYQMVKYGQRFIGTFIVLGLVIHAAIIGYGSLIIRSDLEDTEQKKQINQKMLDDLKKKIAESKIDVEMVGNQIYMFQQIKGETRTPVPFFSTLAAGIKPPVQLKSIKWSLGDKLDPKSAAATFKSYNLLPEDIAASQGAKPPASPPAAAPAATSPTVDNDVPMPPLEEVMTATLSFEFPAGLKTPVLFRKFSEDFLLDLHNALPDMAIAYTSIPSEYVEVKSLQMNFDQKQTESTLGQMPVTVEVMVRGKMAITEVRVDKP